MLQPDDFVAGRFQVIKEIGHGGMGQVYLVRDSLRSGQQRALKTILPVYSQDRRFGERFLSEVGAALKITHPNVCRVYDLDVDSASDPPLYFFTMEYIVGETLAERIAKESEITPERALVLLRGIAAGLDAAHSQHVIHRDLKPGNVMLANSEWSRPVLMDFGLAKMTDVESPVTKTLDQLGTPAYMAPEQFSKGALSPATDIYSLGRIVSELVKSPQSARWDKAVDRALCRNPDGRYGSATEMVRQLEDAIRWTLCRRRILWAGAGAATLSLSGAGIRYLLWEGNSTVPLIMLAPTTHTLNRPKAADSARAFSRVLAYQIGRSDRIAVVGQDRVRERCKQLGGGSQPDERLARLIAKAEGAPFVLFAQINDIAGQFQVQLRLEASTRLPKRKIIEFNNLDELPLVASEAASWIRDELRQPGLNPRDPGMPELTTTKWAALEQYVVGDEAWKVGKAEEAILHLEESVRIDPNFAGAEARLGDVLLSQQEPDSGYQHWARAAAIAKKDALTTKELLRIRGLFAADIGDSAESERTFSLYVAAYPSDPAGYFYKASALSELGRVDEAVHLSRQAVALAPKSYAFRVRLAELQADQGAVESAWQILETARTLENGEDWIDQTEAAICFVRRDLETHEKLVIRLKRSGLPATASRGYSLAACIFAARGGFEQSQKELLDGLVFDRAHGYRSGILLKLRLLTQLALLTGDREAARKRCHEMFSLAGGAIERLRVGCLLARSGDIAYANVCTVAGLPDWPIYSHWSQRLAGEISLAKGESRRALAIFTNLPYNAEIRAFPEYTLRAAKAAADGPAVEKLRRLSQSYEIRYATEPERTGISCLKILLELSESKKLE